MRTLLVGLMFCVAARRTSACWRERVRDGDELHDGAVKACDDGRDARLSSSGGRIASDVNWRREDGVSRIEELSRDPDALLDIQLARVP